MELKIKRVENGWYIEKLQKEENENGVYVFSDSFSQYEEDCKMEAEAFVAFLYQIKELLGPSESRYSKHRVVIGIEPGDKSSLSEEEKDYD